MIEPKAGIFLGRMTARVREALWKKVVQGAKSGGCLLAWSSPGEQGFQVETFGETSRKIIDLEGLLLVARERK